jgi:hypothetical protein
MMESLWSSMQIELLNRRKWRTRLELANAMFEYIEIFHNRQRRHTQLGYLSPIEFELTSTAPLIPACPRSYHSQSADPVTATAALNAACPNVGTNLVGKMMGQVS